ncbi:MAG: hypothetical protein ACYCSQ_00430 [bacterium]
MSKKTKCPKLSYPETPKKITCRLSSIEERILHTLWLEAVEDTGVVTNIPELTKILAVKLAVDILDEISQKTGDETRKKEYANLVAEFKDATSDNKDYKQGL